MGHRRLSAFLPLESLVKSPPFFDDVPVLRVRDPLADLLGAAEEGGIEYRYRDAVRLAGHSCPTVAGAYRLTALALQALYPHELPQRGGVEASFRDGQADGTTGVVASVVSLLTGAAGEGGFQGLAGQFGRRGLLTFSADQPLDLRFRRRDSGRAVDAMADLRRVPASPEVMPLLKLCLAGEAGPEERLRFQALWQDRVRRILLEHGDDPAVFIIRHVHPHGEVA